MKTPGLYYQTPDGRTIQITGSDIWVIEAHQDKTFGFKRYVDGLLHESHALMKRKRAAIAASAIIQGYQPPRALLRCDKPAD